jgi:hypothetical protein
MITTINRSLYWPVTRSNSTRLTRIIEAFDNAVPYRSTGKRGEYTFEAGGLPYLFQAKKSLFQDRWEIVFTANVHGSTYTPELIKVGTKNAMIVFATVMKIMNEFIAEVHPKVLFFMSDKQPGQSRSDLYSTMIAKYCPDGYSYETSPDGVFDKFTLTKR